MENNSKRLYLYLPDEKDAAKTDERNSESEEKELPRLSIAGFDFSPCTIGDRRRIIAVNKGGGSKGIAIEFIGDYLANDDIIIENVILEQGSGEKGTKTIPIVMEKRTYSDGMCILYWEDENFPIPPKADPNLSRDVFCRTEIDRSFGISFTPKGNPRKALDIIAAIIPIENAKRQASAVWYAWKNCASKESYIKKNNIEIMNRIMKIEKKNNSSFYIRLLKTMLLDPDDFDL